MFKTELKDKYKFLTEYFENGLKSKSGKLAHSILFYGNDISSQYELAVEIARLLNCKEQKNQSCNCINCNWTREHAHPAVMTISKIDNKPSDDESKTVISVKQSQMIKNILLNTSDYQRVFIFCDAELRNEIWTPQGLNEVNFQEETANSLLKIIEEPPKNTTFFFLTRDKEDLISTIISRSQSFYVPSFETEQKTFNHIESLFSNYGNFERSECFDMAQTLFAMSKETDSITLLDEIQNYLLATMKANINNQTLKNKILKDINTVENAKKQINARLNPQLAFENMFLNLTK